MDRAHRSSARGARYVSHAPSSVPGFTHRSTARDVPILLDGHLIPGRRGHEYEWIRDRDRLDGHPSPRGRAHGHDEKGRAIAWIARIAPARGARDTCRMRHRACPDSPIDPPCVTCPSCWTGT